MSHQRRTEPTTLDEQLTQLIRHGRDREAAVLATQRLATHTQGDLMDPRKQLDEILPRLNALVGSLSDTQLDAPTACSKFAVRDILQHMIGGATSFAGAFRGEAPLDRSGETDLVATFPKAMADLQQAVHSRGALDRTIAAPWGDVPADAFARFAALDGLVHGWDIATATGKPYEPPAALVAEIDAFSRQAISEQMRDGDTFADPVEPPDGASALTQLVAFTGRQV